MKSKGTEISKQVCAFQHCIVLVLKKEGGVGGRGVIINLKAKVNDS
jgi:hypothetical protein